MGLGSSIVDALRLQFEPVAILWSNEMPSGDIQFRRGQWGCVMWMLSQALKGKTAVFDRQTFGCNGGGVGLGFGNQFVKAPGGIDGISYFLSTGGERLYKSPELVKNFVDGLPIIDIPAEYVLFKPMSKLEDGEVPEVVVFAGNPHQISALVTLVNYSGTTSDAVVLPPGAGCHQIGIYAYKEAQSESPRAVLGLTDLAARKNVRQELGDNLFTFTVPYRLFQRMEEDVKGSFLEGSTWKGLMDETDWKG